MTVLGRCATWGCEFSAVRRIEWKEGGGVFCEGCADVLVRAGDTDVTFRESLDDDLAALTEEPEHPCPECEGWGSEWKKTKAGTFDRRYCHPIGPCPACDGTGDAESREQMATDV